MKQLNQNWTVGEPYTVVGLDVNGAKLRQRGVYNREREAARRLVRAEILNAELTKKLAVESHRSPLTPEARAKLNRRRHAQRLGFES